MDTALGTMGSVCTKSVSFMLSIIKLVASLLLPAKRWEFQGIGYGNQVLLSRQKRGGRDPTKKETETVKQAYSTDGWHPRIQNVHRIPSGFNRHPRRYGPLGAGSVTGGRGKYISLKLKHIHRYTCKKCFRKRTYCCYCFKGLSHETRNTRPRELRLPRTRKTGPRNSGALDASHCHRAHAPWSRRTPARSLTASATQGWSGPNTLVRISRAELQTPEAHTHRRTNKRTNVAHTIALNNPGDAPQVRKTTSPESGEDHITADRERVP